MSVNICITNETARAVGVIANRHPDCAIQIEWREGDPEWCWIVTATNGSDDTVYLINDETGSSAPATLSELSRLAVAGLPVIAS